MHSVGFPLQQHKIYGLWHFFLPQKSKDEGENYEWPGLPFFLSPIYCCVRINHYIMAYLSVGFKTRLDLDFSLSWSWSWSWAMYKVYGTFIFVPSPDLGTSGLEPITGLSMWWYLFHSFQNPSYYGWSFKSILNITIPLKISRFYNC